MSSKNRATLEWILDQKLQSWISISMVLIMTHLICAQAQVTDQPPLYRADDQNVVHLDGNNFDQIVNNPNRDYAMMVQFNMAWCRKCRELANKYSYFAGNVSSWNRVFKVGAIICGEGSNINHCDRYTQSFPSTAIFDPPVNHGQGVKHDIGNGTHLTEDQVHEVPNLIQKSVDHLTSLSETGRAPRSWPELRPIRADSIRELATIVSSQNVSESSTVVLVLENQLGKDPQLAKKVVLDLSASSRELVVRRLVHSDELLRELNRTSNDPSPILIVIPNRKIDQIKLVRWDEIESYLPDGNHHKKLVHYLFEEYAQKYEKIQPVYMADLYKALRQSYYVEVLSHKILNFTQIQALSRYTTAIYRNFPFDNENPRRFFMRMDHWLRLRKKDQKVESNDLYAFMRAGNEGFIPQYDNYIHCRSGYPCAMWHLFHTLTVSEFNILTGNETKKSRNPKGQQQAHKQAGQQVLYAFRDYIKFFYNCSECSRNFLPLTVNLDRDLIHSNSSILWLWRAHNLISKRISDLNPSNPKPQFPSRSVCPKCFNSSNHWQTREIVRFLIDYYRRDKLMRVKSGKKQERAEISVIFLTIVSVLFIKILN